jgi:hypothetical protein
MTRHLHSAPSLLIAVSASARTQPLSIARAQAYEAAAPLAGWEVRTVEHLSDEHLSVEHGKLSQLPSADRASAVVLIGATPSEISEWLRSGYGVIADGVWTHDPEVADAVGRIAAEHRQPLLQGAELLHAPVFAGALTEAREIGDITSFETRGLYPSGSHPQHNLLETQGPQVLMRALLSLQMLAPAPCEILWDTAQLRDPNQRDRAQGGSSQSGAPQFTASWRGRILHGSSAVPGRINVVLGTHSGSSMIHDVQVSSTSGVVRAELMPTPSIEVNGEPIQIPPAEHTPAQLEWFGMISMLELMGRAVTQRSQPVTGPGVFAEALRLSAWASAGGGGPFR